MPTKLTAAELDCWYADVSRRIDALLERRKTELASARQRDPLAVAAENRREERIKQAAIEIRRGKR